MKQNYWIFRSLLISAFVCFGLSSCDEDDNSFSKADIVGTWDLIHEEGWEIYDGDKESWSMDLVNENCFEFHADGTGLEYDPSSSHWKDYDEFTYELSGNKLIVDYSYGEKISSTIITLNKTTLILHYTWNDDGERGEQTETYKRME